MKKYICIFAALAAALSCQKEAPQSPETETFSAPATLEIPMTKVSIGDGTYLWTEGDQICVRQYNGNSDPKEALTGTDLRNPLSATSSNSSTTFSGTLYEPYINSTWYIFYPYSAFSKYTNPGSTTGTKITLPIRQTGTFEEFTDTKLYSKLGECLMMTTDNARITVNDGLSVKTEDETKYSKVVFNSVQMNIITPVIKLTIPEELKIKQILFKAYKNELGTSTPLEICGALKMTMSALKVTTLPSGIDGNVYETITIRRDGYISGDVYITIYPDLVSDEKIAGNSSANELYFKFMQGTGSSAKYVEVTKSIQNQLTAGKVLDLGTVPTDLTFINPNASSQASVNFSGTVPSTTPAE